MNKPCRTWPQSRHHRAFFQVAFRELCLVVFRVFRNVRKQQLRQFRMIHICTPVRRRAGRISFLIDSLDFGLQSLLRSPYLIYCIKISEDVQYSACYLDLNFQLLEFFQQDPHGVEDAKHCDTGVCKYGSPNVGKSHKTQYQYQQLDC